MSTIQYLELKEIINKVLKEQNIKIEDFGITKKEFNDNNIICFDMALIKKLEGSNTSGKGATNSNQSSIILTGEQSAIFPCIKRAEFYSEIVGKNMVLKHNVRLMKNNILYLKNQDFHDTNKVIDTYLISNETTDNRVEMGCKTLDGDDYVEFYELLAPQSFLIILKLRSRFQYIILAIKYDDADKYFTNMDIADKNIYYFYKINKISKGTKEQVTFIDDSNIVVNSSKIDIGCNNLLYGAPGTGKSHTLEKESKGFDFVERVTFYPEYTHDDFIGCFMPCMSYVQDDTTKYISADGTPAKIPGKPVPYYTYVPGPFTNALVAAINNPDKNVLLIVEELNRANAAAVFGEVFQLLDRKDSGESKYSVSISNEYSEYLASEIETYSKGQKIRIPANLTICATMNSADQGVNPLDSAFKRRWNFEYVPIDFSKANHKNYEIDYAGKKVTWQVFAITINEQLKCKDINEDKHLGQYFITETEIVDSYKFASKILLYLFDDVLKFNRRGFFKSYKTFSDLLAAFNDGKEVFEFTFKYVTSGEDTKEKNIKSSENAMDIDAESKVSESNEIKYEEQPENADKSNVAEE